MKIRSTHAAAVAAFAALLSLPARGQTTHPSPIRGLPGDGAVREVRLDGAQAEAIRAERAAFRLADFPLPGGGGVDLELEPFEVLAPDAQVVLGTAQGDVEIGRPEVSLFRGRVAGEPDSRVFLSLSPLGANGLVQTGGSTLVLSSGGFGAGLPTVIADLADFPEPPEFARGWECGVGPEHVNPLGLDLDALGGGGDQHRDNPCRIARIAIDSDFEYTSWLFGGDVDASAAYAVTLLGAVSEIYARDLNVRLVVPFVRVWGEDVDPYQGGNLDLFRAEWNANMRHVRRELAHMLSGNYGGGVAWVSVLCSNTYGYGLSGVGGSFPYPLRDHDHGNWDLFVVAHELGHNFGTLHTHDGYDPPIDGCGLGDCTLAWGGTIMSYCHGCPGGMSNIVLAFHPRVITQISAYLAGACDILGEGLAYAYEDEGLTIQDEAVTIDVLANDLPINCATPGLYTVQGVTDRGGSAAISHGTGDEGRDEVLYTPAPGFAGLDTFFYLMQTDRGVIATGNVSVQVIAPRPGGVIGVSRAGLAVDYYALQGPDRLPDFDALTPVKRDYVAEVNFPSSSGSFATSGMFDNVGAVFHASLRIPETGLYTLSIESDDGSRLLLSGETVIDNDGLHGMVERSAPLALGAGWHPVRLEYFERSGAAGLVARIEGPGLPRQVIPASFWRMTDCVGDWVPDGTVNTIDFIAFLASWTARDPAADLDDNGQVNSADVVAFLNAWVGGCD